MKKYNGYADDLREMKTKLLNEINQFFVDNGDIVIDLLENDGSPITVDHIDWANVEIDRIKKDGVDDFSCAELTYQYEDLDLWDLSAIIDIMNNWLEQ